METSELACVSFGTGAEWLCLETSELARVAGTRAIWDRSGVALYITLPGDFQSLFSSSSLHLISTHLHTITVDSNYVCNVEATRRLHVKMN